MKRGTISADIDSNAKRGRQEVSPIETMFSDLPRDILVNILLRLCIKRIFVCKFVCKTLYDLISGPEFAKCRFDEGEVYPLIRKSQSRSVYLVKPDNDDLERKLGMCDHDHTQYSKSGCVICTVDIKIDTKFKILESKKKDKKDKSNCEYIIANSCNGFLCLFDPSDSCLPIVCNPITGEFINLPKPKKVELQHTVRYGFGFSAATNEYKVIRMFKGGVRDCNMAEVHILGTNMWKDIGIAPRELPKFSRTYLNGFLYWSCYVVPISIFTFDFEKERVGFVRLPILMNREVCGSVGVLGGELIYTSLVSPFNVWAMKDYGNEKEWSKVFSFEFVYSDPTPYFGEFRPIKYLNDGAFLMFHSWCSRQLDDTRDINHALLYMDTKRNRFRFLKIHGADSKVELIAHTPSFISLAHVLSGQNVNVHNVTSRCSELKLHKETKDIAIVEEELLYEYRFGF